jgi:hypothetical protein
MAPETQNATRLTHGEGRKSSFCEQKEAKKL